VAGGLFCFSEAKHAYYSGSSLIWVPQYDAAKVAEQESERAIDLFTISPDNERNLADEALAHIYFGTARATLGERERLLNPRVGGSSPSGRAERFRSPGTPYR